MWCANLCTPRVLSTIKVVPTRRRHKAPLYRTFFGRSSTENDLAKPRLYLVQSPRSKARKKISRKSP